MTLQDLAVTILTVVLTLMVFSYLFGDRLFFGIATHILIGVSAAFVALVTIRYVIIPFLVTPLADTASTRFWLTLVPLLFSVLLLLMLLRRGARAGMIPLAVIGGVLAALAVIGVTRGTLAPQLLSIYSLFDPKALMQGAQPQWSSLVEAMMILLGVISVLFVFHHQGQQKSGRVVRPVFLEGVGSIGQIFIGITFGALFVGLFSTALIALINSLSEIIFFIQLWF